MSATLAVYNLYYIAVPTMVVISLAISTIAYSAFRRRLSNDEADDSDDCESLLGTCHLKKTSTFYQWNQAPPSSCCSLSVASLQQSRQQVNAASDDDDDEDNEARKEIIEEDRRLLSCWEQRRSLLLQKYAATNIDESSQTNCNTYLEQQQP